MPAVIRRLDQKSQQRESDNGWRLDFRAADLRQANFRGVNLIGADLITASNAPVSCDPRPMQSLVEWS